MKSASSTCLGVEGDTKQKKGDLTITLAQSSAGIGVRIQ